MRHTLLFGLIILTGAITASGQNRPAPAAKAAPIGVLALRLRMNSMEPSTLTVPAGGYLIRIVNGILPGVDVSYELKRVPGKADPQGVAVGVLATYPSAANKVGRKGAAHTRMLVKLEPGDYILWAGGRREWQCQLTVTEAK